MYLIVTEKTENFLEYWFLFNRWYFSVKYYNFKRFWFWFLLSLQYTVNNRGRRRECVYYLAELTNPNQELGALLWFRPYKEMGLESDLRPSSAATGARMIPLPNPIDLWIKLL